MSCLFGLFGNDAKQQSPFKDSLRKKGQTGLFEQPRQLIKTDISANKIYYVDETLTLLRGLDGQVNVVAITGQYRTGKSYLLNRLAGQANGFGVGNSTNACTKGIWIRCIEHPSQTDQVLVLLDVEGFGDIHKANKNEDLLLFTLATLLCSTLVYNNIGAFDADAIKRLKFLKNIDMCVVDKTNDVDLLDFYLPQFVLTLRDFDLDLKTQAGVTTTPDGYFDDLLGQKEDKDRSSGSYNDTRLLIRKYFKGRKCFVFKRPHIETKGMETKSDADLNPEFLKNVKRFREFVYACRPMTMKSGQPVKGRMFASLVQSYVDQISKGKSPCIRDALVEMRRIENEVVLEEACAIYSEEMKRRLALINPKESGFVNHHKLCMEKALQYFKTAVVFDDEQICQKQMQDRFKELYATFKEVCDKNSRDCCLDVLNRLNMEIVKNLEDKVYAKKGGYNDYLDDLKTLIKRYDDTCGLGTQSQNVLQAFLDGKEAEEENVYQLEMKATGEIEGNSIMTGNKKVSVKLIGSHIAELSEELESVNRRIIQELREKQETSYQDMKQKYIENLSLQVGEIDRQIREGTGVNVDALQDEKVFLNKLINASKEMEVIDELIEKLYATHTADRPVPSETDQVPGRTIYDIPWEYKPQPTSLEHPDSDEVPELEESGVQKGMIKRSNSVRRKRFCFIQ